VAQKSNLSFKSQLLYISLTDEAPKFGGFPSIFTQWLKLGISNLIHSLGLPRPIIKPHPEEKVGLALGWGAPQNFVVLLQYLHNG